MLLDASLNFNKINSLLRDKIVQRLIQLSIVVTFLVCATWIQADSLFDFQMTMAKKGNAEAEFKIGEMYETGFGVKKDIKEAQIWINKAAAQGHEAAGFKLLYWDIEKNGLKGDNKKIFTELRTKAANGSPQAMYYLGKMYAHGVGIKRNYDKSLDWLNKATFEGVQQAESEALLVRDMKQKSLARSRKAEEKRKADEKAKLEEENKLAAQRKAEEDEKNKISAIKKEQDAKLQAQKKKDRAAKAKEKNDQVKLAEAEAQRKAAAEAKSKAIAIRKRQALLKKQAAQKKIKEKESQFEADPCSGKSARFLSTCR